jgi:hypothetical protein
MTIEEAQYLLEISHFSLNPAVAPHVPLIAVHWGHGGILNNMILQD